MPRRRTGTGLRGTGLKGLRNGGVRALRQPVFVVYRVIMKKVLRYRISRLGTEGGPCKNSMSFRLFRPKHLSTLTAPSKSLIRAMSSKPSPYKANIDSIEPLPEGKWIQTRKVNYTDPAGKKREWEMVIRTTRTATTDTDAVCIAAFISHPGTDRPREVVLTKQFRPPCGKVVIEFPAGLVDPNESIETTAVRELHEETGYHGTFVRLSNQEVRLFSDPGLANTTLALAFMEIDLSDERNQKPVQQLEDTEFIESFTLPVALLYSGLIELCEKEGCVLDARLYHFAAGVELLNSNHDLITKK